MKTRFGINCLLSLMLVSGLAFQAGAYADIEPAEPFDIVSSTHSQVREVLMKEDGTNTSEIRAETEKLLLPRFDFLRMTALALGRPWRTATPEQQDMLINEFRELLTGTYFNTMLRYRDATIKIDENVLIENKGRESTVRSKVKTSDAADPVAIDYVLYKTDAGWKVFNVNVEGASLVTVYRNQFGQEVNKSGIDGLIQSLKNKNQKIKGQDAPGSEAEEANDKNNEEA